MRRVLTIVLVTLAIATVVVTAGCGGAKVPDVVGMRQGDAVRALEDEGYLLGNVSLVATDGVEPGMIAGQVPAAGERAKEGTKVDLAVSFTDGERVLVPNVIGLTETTANTVATTTGLVPLFTDQYSSDVVKGQVAEQVPEPNAEVTAGSTLVMVLSKGEEPEKAKVPDVVGDSKGDATGAIEKAGFVAEVFEVYNSDVSKGDVIAQLPEGGDSEKVGSTVQIMVSLGKGTGSAKVPDVVGDAEGDATDAIEKAGLKVEKISDYSADVAKGDVIEQFPDPGSTAAKGSEVLIVVSKGKEPVDTVKVPNVVGSMEDAATTKLEDAGLTVSAEEAASDETPGTVLYQFPSASSEVAPDTDVLIVVSSGQ